MALVYIVANVGKNGKVDLSRVPVKGDFIAGRSHLFEVHRVVLSPFEEVDAVAYATEASQAVKDELQGAVKTLQKEGNG